MLLLTTLSVQWCCPFTLASEVGDDPWIRAYGERGGGLSTVYVESSHLSLSAAEGMYRMLVGQAYKTSGDLYMFYLFKTLMGVESRHNLIKQFNN